MQIFAPYSDPVLSAKILDDQRIRKMITESAQLLSAAVRSNNGNTEGLYKYPPSGRELYAWAANSGDNFEWLGIHTLALIEEAQHRFSKVPSSAEICRLAIDSGSKMEYPSAGLTPHVNRARSLAHGVDMTSIQDVHDAYRQYLSKRWELSSPKWTNPSVIFIENITLHDPVICYYV